MAKPRFGYVNHFADVTNATISGSMAEIAYPVSNLAGPSANQKWVLRPVRSDYQTIRIDSKNNKINFNIGAAELTVTLQTGQYRWAELASEVATQMNTAASTSDIDCTYDSSAYVFTITKGAGTLQLLCATGTNKQVSAYASMGFDCSSDKTGALTYTASYVTTSTWGRFVIDATNNQFYFKLTAGGNLTASITAGTYSARSLCSEIKYQLDTQASVTDFDVTWSESLKKFIINKASGTWETRFATTTNSIADTIGFPDSDDTGLSSKTADDVRIHTSEYLLVTLTTAQQIKQWFLAGLNLTSAATLKVESHTADSWSAPDYTHTFTYGTDWFSDGRAVKFETSSPPTKAYHRIYIVDRENSAGYVQVGIEAVYAYFELSRNVKWGGQVSWRTSESFSESDYGNSAGVIRSRRWVGTYEIQAINSTDFDNLDALIAAVGTVHPFVVSFDADNFLEKETRYVKFEREPEFRESPATGATHDVTMQLIEAK